MSIKQTYIEARQKGTKTIQGNNNGDFTTILNRPIMMRSNDELTLVNAFVDTIDITDNHILVEEDTTIEIAYYMYDTMGGQNSKLGNLGNDDQKKSFWGRAPNNPVMVGNGYGVLCQYKRPSSMTNFRIATALTFRILDPTKNTAGKVNITINYFMPTTEGDETPNQSGPATIQIKLYELYDPAQPQRLVNFPLDNKDGRPHFIFDSLKPVTISREDEQLANIGLEPTMPNPLNINTGIMVPLKRTYSIAVKAGRYSPVNMVKLINGACINQARFAEATDPRGGGREPKIPFRRASILMENTEFQYRPEDRYLKNYDSLGPHFMTQSNYFYMGDGAQFQTTWGSVIDSDPESFYFCYRELITQPLISTPYKYWEQVYAYNNTIRSELSQAASEQSFYIGASEAFQLVYDEETSKINIQFAHTPLMVPFTTPGGEVSMKIGIQAQQSAYIVEQLGTADPPTAADPATGMITLVYEPDPSDAGNPGTTARQWNYSKQAGGIIIADLQPKSFWESLGFDVPALSALPIYDTDNLSQCVGITTTFAGMLKFQTSPLGTYQAGGAPYLMPHFDLELGRNIIGNLGTLADLRSVENEQDFYSPGIGMPGNAAGQPAAETGRSFISIDTTETTEIKAPNVVVGANLDSAYYLVEININGNEMLNSDGGGSNNIVGIINRYYSVSSYTSTEGGFTYVHKGEPININTLQIRILNPDRTPVLNLGTDNSLFLKLSQQILTNLEIQANNNIKTNNKK